MRHAHETIDASRLCEAADAVLDAVQEIAHRTGGRYEPPFMLMGTEHQPLSLCGFTRYEVAEATAMLCRLGLMPKTRA